MSRTSLWIALALLLSAGLALPMGAADGEAEAKAPVVIEAQLTGRSLDRVLLPPLEGLTPPAWVVMTSGSEGVPRVDLFAPRASQTPIPLFGELPEDASALAVFDLDGDGAAELLVGGDGWLASLGPITDLADKVQNEPEARRPALLRGRIESPGLDLDAMGRANLLAAGGPDLPFASAGHLLLVRAGGTVANRPLPTQVRRSSTGLTLTSPPVQRLPNGTLVAGPEAHGDLRLRSLLFPSPADESVEPTEAWSRFNGPEAVATAQYTLLDGAPVLVTTTYRADKLGIFERQKLRIFALGTDRTRAGEAPRFEAITESRRWQRADPHLVDLDDDGRQDLLLVHSKGLGGKEVLVDAWSGKGGGRFHTKARRSVLKFDALAWDYGSDLTGDGMGDLVVAAENRIALFAGTPAGEKRPMERDPHWSYTLPSIQPEGEGEEAEVSVSVGSDGASSEGGGVHPFLHFEIDPGEVNPAGILIERNVSSGSQTTLHLTYLSAEPASPESGPSESAIR